MEKTKLGISLGLAGAILYCLGLFGGYTITVLAMAYVLIFENSVWLKKTAVKVLIFCLTFSLLSVLVQFLPNCLALLNSLLSLFNEYIDYNIIVRLQNIAIQGLNLLEIILFIVMGVMAFLNKSIPIPGLEGFLDKQFEVKEEQAEKE